MITESGIVIADDSEESFWANLKKDANKRIGQMQHEIIINESIVELANRYLAKYENYEVDKNGR